MAEDEGVCLAPGGYGGGWMVGFLLGGDILGEDLPVGGGWWEGFRGPRDTYVLKNHIPSPVSSPAGFE